MNIPTKLTRALLVLAIFAAFTLPTASAWENNFTSYSADETSHDEDNSRPQVVARSGSFPALNPRVTDTKKLANDHGTATGPPVYRVLESDEATVEANAGLPLDETPESSRSKMIGPLVTVASSLAIVLALFCALVWAGRKFGGGAAASKPLPASALTPLGHVMLDPRTKLMLVKCGRRILVLSQTASGITPITEVTHPDEVRELIANCSSEAREVFQRTLREIELEPVKGFTDAPPTPASNARQSGRLFATA
ncbi:flagellar biosynthetic protein FliO [Rhodopirellula sp. ICT_H3.1]|uniref:Flagellar protein n=1 Tax=Aporhodopirellula aestuarii TaxID=2950107 RepID=A0ABT0U0M8_9BACT|nr:flagellar biosynthetic protein FliO [Aporhodopirellula aestuarii]MCM2370438.1 flagellar biosynthetic protein FliO [Aporhodopirellula aestuarii]